MSVKLHEGFCLDSARRRFHFGDHFLGDSLRDLWRSTGTGSATVIDQQDGGICRLTTGAVDGNGYYIDWNDIRSLLASKKVTLEIRAKLNIANDEDVRFQLYFDANNRMQIYKLTSNGTWIIYTRDGVTNSAGSGVSVDTDYHIYRIEVHTHGSNHAHFYIDGVETANSPLTTNIPTSYLQPRIDLTTREDVAKTLDIDYIVVRQDR